MCSTGGIWQRLEGAGPQLGGEVLLAVLFTVALEDVKRLQMHGLQEDGHMDKEEKEMGRCQSGGEDWILMTGLLTSNIATNTASMLSITN